MNVIRSLARIAPRSASRLSVIAIRPQPSFRSVVATSSPCMRSMPRLTASFHITAARSQDSEVQEELVAKLENELVNEEDQSEDEDLTGNIKQYLEDSAYTLEDKPGHQEVSLTRKFGDETIRVTFSTADLDDGLPPDELADSALYDGDVENIEEGQSGGASTKGASNQGLKPDGNLRVTPRNPNAVSDEELDTDYDEDSPEQGFAVRLNIQITRPGKGALSIEATASDGDIVIDDFYFFPNEELADPQTAERDWQRRTLYAGPPFSNLDEDLQILLEKYLEERGINTRMALFVPDYVDHKEQKEYVKWLKGVKNFVA